MLRRLPTAPELAPGCHELRPPSATQPLGPRWPSPRRARPRTRRIARRQPRGARSWQRRWQQRRRRARPHRRSHCAARACTAAGSRQPPRLRLQRCQLPHATCRRAAQLIAWRSPVRWAAAPPPRPREASASLVRLCHGLRAVAGENVNTELKLLQRTDGTNGEGRVPSGPHPIRYSYYRSYF